MREIKTSNRHTRKNVKIMEALLAGGEWAAYLLGGNPSARTVDRGYKQLHNDQKFFVRIDSGPARYI